MRSVTTLRYMLFGLLFVAGLGLLIVSVNSYQSTRAFVGDASTAEGTVVEFVESRSESSSSRSGPTAFVSVTYRPIVKFTTKGGESIEFTSRSGTNPPSYSKGEKVGVLYSETQPQKAEIHGFMELWGGALFSGILGAVFFLIGGGIIFVLHLKSRSGEKRGTNGVRIRKG